MRKHYYSKEFDCMIDVIAYANKLAENVHLVNVLHDNFTYVGVFVEYSGKNYNYQHQYATKQNKNYTSSTVNNLNPVYMS